MRMWLILSVIFCFASTYSVFAIENEKDFCNSVENNTIKVENNTDYNLLEDSLLNIQNIDESGNKAYIDTTNKINLIIAEDSLRISQTDFMYSDNFRYTINGNLPYKKTDVDYLRFGIFGGALTGFMVGQHIYQVNTIWSEKASFRFIEDGDYALYSDKIGHFYGAYFAGSIYTEMLMWCGFSRESATITGALMGVAYSTYVEVMDGFAENWGFSPTDFYSDVAGFGFFLLQYYEPWFQNITPKFHYFPAEWHGEKRRSPSEFFIDDYSSQTLYLSINVHNMLPDNLKNYWAPWLQLTVGYAARNLSNPSDPNSNYDPNYSTKYSNFLAGSPRLIIGLDYDMVKLLPDGPPIWNWFRQALNLIKFPAPAIEISERGTSFMLMYPFLKF